MSYNDEFIKGGIVGMLHAIVGHPLDTLKTLKQGEHTLIYRVNQQGIRENLKLGKLWNGFSFCMFRTFLISGISFTVYELC